MLNSYHGLLGYFEVLLIVTGWLTVRFEAKQYAASGKRVEQRAAKIAGWLNIAAGIALFAGSWILSKWT
jgi:hypothetical protein